MLLRKQAKRVKFGFPASFQWVNKDVDGRVRKTLISHKTTTTKKNRSS
jgi:hypothetical protein